MYYVALYFEMLVFFGMTVFLTPSNEFKDLSLNLTLYYQGQIRFSPLKRILFPIFDANFFSPPFSLAYLSVL